jgi:hypothetical protein
MEGPHQLERPARMLKRRMGGGTKDWLITLGVGACFLLLFFGGIVYVLRNFEGEGSSDPAKIEAIRNEIAKFNLPAGFLPATYGRIGEFRGVAYANPDIDGGLLLLECARKTHDREVESSSHLAEKLGQSHLTTDSLLNAKSQIKQIKIKGKECTFEFSQGIDPATRQMHRRVSGMFEGKGGPTTIEVEMDESAYRENDIVAMLEGIQ